MELIKTSTASLCFAREISASLTFKIRSPIRKFPQIAAGERCVIFEMKTPGFKEEPKGWEQWSTPPTIDNPREFAVLSLTSTISSIEPSIIIKLGGVFLFVVVLEVMLIYSFCATGREENEVLAVLAEVKCEGAETVGVVANEFKIGNDDCERWEGDLGCARSFVVAGVEKLEFWFWDEAGLLEILEVEAVVDLLLDKLLCWCKEGTLVEGPGCKIPFTFKNFLI